MKCVLWRSNLLKRLHRSRIAG